MRPAFNLYADDSGSRKPDRKEENCRPGWNWFGLGGLLIAEEHEEEVRSRYAALQAAWPEIKGAPLHSTDIRGRKKTFSWMNVDLEKADRFMADVAALLCESPIICIGAVIDRPGYMTRYEKLYEPGKRWSLCKTAFSILVERSVKFARTKERVLRVFVERGDKDTDRVMKEYYETLRRDGMPFNSKNMSEYTPLTHEQMHETLYDFKTKDKSSPLMQLADLCLYPLCRVRYDATYRPYQDLVTHNRVIDCILDPADVKSLGVKYSCFDTTPAPQATVTDAP